MGGGAAIRVAAKAAVLGGYRTAEAALGRRTPRPPVVPAAAAASPSISAAVADSGRVVAPPPPPPDLWRESEFDDWELAGSEEELFDAIHPSPRMVFGGVPTLQEAKEATADLKEAVDQVYFTPSPAEESLENSQISTTSEKSVVLPEVPKPVMHAFSLLQAPEAQNVVASIASDPNVWDALMKNESVMQFYKSQECAAPPTEGNVAEDGESDDSAERLATADEESSESSPLWDFMNKVKAGVSEMVGNISDLLQEIMGTSAGATTSKTTPHGSAAESIAMGASFLALAVAAILVVLLKRGA